MRTSMFLITLSLGHCAGSAAQEVPRPPITGIAHLLVYEPDSNAFYKEILGFRLYWHSLAHPDGSVDYVSMQVPDGSDWLEYMQNLQGDHSIRRLTSADHFAPGVVSITDAQKTLESRGWHPTTSNPATRRGNDGKWQLNLPDPAGTRVELMEFQPTAKPTVPFTGPQPTPEGIR
jgi:catechol 2,3-dioxygenase-like lactoylglutathione lyase family enzyme